MNTSNQDQSQETKDQSSEAAAAFSDLDRARSALRDAEQECKAQRNGLRRFAYKHKLTLRQARSHWHACHRDDYVALITAEVAHGRALREFRRIAMIAALTRVIDTDRRLNAAA